METNQTLCINSTVYPYYVVFYEVPSDTVVAYYKDLSSSRKLILNQISDVGSLPFAVMSDVGESLYRLTAKSKGLWKIAVISDQLCINGTLVTSAHQFEISFDSDHDSYTALEPGITRCLIFVHPTTGASINLSLKFISDVDTVTYYTNPSSPQTFTGIFSSQITIEPNSPPSIIRISVGDQKWDRHVHIVESATNEGLDDREIIFGPAKVVNAGEMPTPTPLIVEVSGISSLLTIVMSVMISLLVVILLAVVVRYGLPVSWCPTLHYHSYNDTPPPMMPSDFMMTQQRPYS